VLGGESVRGGEAEGAARRIWGRGEEAMRRWVCSSIALMVAVLVLAWVVVPRVSARASRLQTGHLRVATKPLEPFVFKQGEEWAGFSIDLWNAIAQRLGLDFEWVEVKNVQEQLEAVQTGQADAAIAGISMTAEREKLIDFSHPYFDAGLQILTRPLGKPSVWQQAANLLTPGLLWVIALGVLFGLVMGHVVWLIERRRNPEFPSGYVRGVTEGVWWLFLVVATGEYRDSETRSVVKHMLTAVWWLIGVALIAQFTATIAANLTVQQLTSTISGPGDLPGKSIATVGTSTAAAFLSEHGLPFVPVERIEDAYALLDRGQVQAVVYDSPVLMYYASTKGKGRAEVVGPIFKPEKYGIALPPGSPLRKPINETLLGLYQDGTYEAIRAKWFGGVG
jgi:polar amino acid transport system substrate-binding protein